MEELDYNYYILRDLAIKVAVKNGTGEVVAVYSYDFEADEYKRDDTLLLELSENPVEVVELDDEDDINEYISVRKEDML